MNEKSLTVTMKYKTISEEEFAIAMHKVCQTPVGNQAACAIRRVSKALNKARDLIAKEYTDEIVEKFGAKDANGKIIIPKGSMFTVDETKRDEFNKAQDEFGKKEVILECGPLTSTELSDIKLSGRDLEVMGELFSETPTGRSGPQALRGPGLPGMNV